MPRNIDPQVGDLQNVQLYQLDDLKVVVDSNMKLRNKAIDQVRAMIDQKCLDFYNKVQKLPPLGQDDAVQTLNI